MEGRTLLRVAVLTICVAVTALGWRNSSGDNTEAVALATSAACAGADGCQASLGQQARSSFGHEYSFTLSGGAKDGASKGNRTQIIACKRALIFIGDWECKPKGFGP